MILLKNCSRFWNILLLFLLDRKLGMSNEGWPNWKGCKLTSKPHPRHTQEISQIGYKITTEAFPTPAHGLYAHSGYKLTYGTSSSNLQSVQFSSSVLSISLRNLRPGQGYGFSSGHVWMWELDCEESWVPKKLMLLNCSVGEDSWESLGLQGDQTSQS